MSVTFAQLENIHNVLVEHYDESKKGRIEYLKEDATDLFQMYLSAPYPPLGLSGKDIAGLSAWLNDEAERAAEDETGDFYSGMYKALLVLVFDMLREGRPPWR